MQMGEVVDLRKMLGDMLIGAMLRRGDVSVLYEARTADAAREAAIRAANGSCAPCFHTKVIPFACGANGRQNGANGAPGTERRVRC